MNNEGIENRTIVTNFNIIAQAITTKIFRFTDRIFRRYLHYHFIGKKITDKIIPLVSPLVIKKILLQMDLLTKKASKKKTISFR